MNESVPTWQRIAKAAAARRGIQLGAEEVAQIAAILRVFDHAIDVARSLESAHQQNQGLTVLPTSAGGESITK